MFSAVLAVGLFMLFFAILILLAYLPFSLGLYRMAMKCRVDNAWMAWIPIANFYIMGLIIKELKFQNYEVPNPELVLPAAVALNFVIGRIPYIGFLYGVTLLALMLLAFFRLFTIFKKDSAMQYTLFSVIPIVGAFLVLSVSKYDPEY